MRNFHFACSGSLFTNSNWFAFEDDRVSNECSTGALASASPNTETAAVVNGEGEDDEVVGGEDDDDLDDTATSSEVSEGNKKIDHSSDESKDSKEAGPSANEKPPAWVEWRETPGSNEASGSGESAAVPNGEVQVKLEGKGRDDNPPSSSSSFDTSEIVLGTNESLSSTPPESSASPPVTKDDATTTSGTESAPEITEDVGDPTKETKN